MKIKIVSVFNPWSDAYLVKSVALPASLFTEVRRKIAEQGFLESNEPFAVVELDGKQMVLAWLEGTVYVGDVPNIDYL